MAPVPAALKYYKSLFVQQAILDSSKNREVGIRYSDTFGRRPDVLRNPRDVWEAVKQGATSFHISEERWNNPLDLDTALSPRELDSMRCGWDLVFDIDCPYWDYSRLITDLLVKVLREEGVEDIGVKFSGNKGFHVCVQFESFPGAYRGKTASELFPEEAKKVMSYVLNKVSSKFKVSKDEDILAKTDLPIDSLKVYVCSTSGCGNKIPYISESLLEYVCDQCHRRKEVSSSSPYVQCEHCNRWMVQMGAVKSITCTKCRGTSFTIEHDIVRFIKLDEGLISSRHMFRAPYSLHEKSNLVSLPISSDDILTFEREMANPELVKGNLRSFFPEVSHPGSAIQLFESAFDHVTHSQKVPVQRKDFQSLTLALSEETFPPCIRHIFKGMKDGRKRASFALIAFLSSVGWDIDAIEKRIFEWNEKNNPPLRKGGLQSQIRQWRMKQSSMMPPNCDNKAYYVDIGVCTPDGLCARIRNPANYAILRAKEAPRAKREKVQQG